MFRYLETIRYDGGIFQNLSYHKSRFNRTRKDIFKLDPIDLLISIPQNLNSQVTYRVRVLYRESIDEVQFIPYLPKVISSFKFVDGGDIEYSHKSEDRESLNSLVQSVTGEPIIVKGGSITDTTFGNLIFFDGRDWLTPDTPLLRGVERERLLDNGLIRESQITVTDLVKFSTFKMINAMLPFDIAPVYSVDIIESIQ